MSVTVTGLDSALDLVERLPGEVRTAGHRGAMAAAEEFASEAQATAPVLSGDYQSSIRAEETGDGAEVVDGVPYGSIVRERTQHTADAEARAPETGLDAIRRELDGVGR